MGNKIGSDPANFCPKIVEAQVMKMLGLFFFLPWYWTKTVFFVQGVDTEWTRP